MPHDRDMTWDPDHKPRLRPLEAFRSPDGNHHAFGLRDPTGLSPVMLSVSYGALQLMSLMDGERTCEQIRDAFSRSFGHDLSPTTLADMLGHLERAFLLEGPAFDAFYRDQLLAYRSRPARELLPHSVLRTLEQPAQLLNDILDEAQPVSLDRPVRGLVAPHLDYPRGRPCYAAAYATLRGRPVPTRVVILGTNHFGRSPSVVATRSHFETPFGITRTDTDFLGRLESSCGCLTEFELDHRLEHSVELQVAWLQHLFGADSFVIVPILCPDPCGPTGTRPINGQGVDLRDFAATLARAIAADGSDSLLLAGADLSHVGAHFGDKRPLSDAFLEKVQCSDEDVLRRLTNEGADGWIQGIAGASNCTRICSAGCIFAVAAALADVRPTVLRYHQAVDQNTQTCVTCAAVAWT